MKRMLLTFLLFCPIFALAQMAKSQDVVWLSSGDSLWAIPPSPTQTVIRPGWKIADVINTKDKVTRYVWKATSLQHIDNPQPRFVIRVGEGTLHDFIIVPLKQKKEYREFARPNPLDCSPIYIDLSTCRIEMLADDRYAITLQQPLPIGEYAIIDTTAKPINKEGDLTLYTFTITKY